jgi:hypothetical protein
MRNIFKNNSLASALAGVLVGVGGTVGTQVLMDTNSHVREFSESAYERLTDTNEGDVYITPSGEKYHIYGCYIINKAKINNTLKCVERDEAEDVGYLPCKKCNP